MMQAYHYVITMVYFSYWHTIAKRDHLNSKPGLLCLYWSELCCTRPCPVVFCCCCDPIMSCLGYFGWRLKRCINPSVIPVYFKIRRNGALVCQSWDPKSSERMSRGLVPENMARVKSSTCLRQVHPEGRTSTALSRLHARRRSYKWTQLDNHCLHK